jgi:uncharacterized protein
MHLFTTCLSVGEGQSDKSRKEKRKAEKMANNRNSGRGFAGMDEEQRRAIASKGGQSVPAEKRAFSQDRELAASAGRTGGTNSQNNRSGNTERSYNSAGRDRDEDGRFASQYEPTSRNR